MYPIYLCTLYIYILYYFLVQCKQNLSSVFFLPSNEAAKNIHQTIKISLTVILSPVNSIFIGLLKYDSFTIVSVYSQHLHLSIGKSFSVNFI